MKFQIFQWILILICSACTSYAIPMQTDDHPANVDTPTVLIELSPILEMNDDICSEL